MAVSLDLALSPSSLFADITTKDIPNLLQKTNDKFIVIPSKTYSKIVLSSIEKSKLPPIYKRYMSQLVRYENGEKVDLAESFGGSSEINFNDVQKYFGEVLGPINLMKSSRKDFSEVIFPVRTNYQLFDFFLKYGNRYIGYSSKSGGDASNTLTPTVISERIKKNKISYGTNKEIMFGRNVMTALGEGSIVDGLMKVTGLMVDAGKLPSTMDRKMISAMNGVDWKGSALVMQTRRTSAITSMGIRGVGKIEYFLSNYVIPRTKLDQRLKNAYISGRKKYTGNNVAYGLGMMIVDANKEGILDASPFLRTLFNDLNLIKLTLTQGTPQFRVVNLAEYEGAKFQFRSKYRWDVVKDKLGIQL